MSQASFDFGDRPDEAPAPVVDDTLSIGEAVRRVNDCLTAGFGGLIWLRGEIHNLKLRNGHRYFDLVDDHDGRADVRQRPKLSANLFAQQFQRLSARLEHAGLRLEDGLRVRVRGSFELYGPSGRLNFRVVDVDPEFTLGNLTLRRDELLRRLAAEGLVAANGALPMPLVPLRVGVVTSSDSEGWHDFSRILADSGIGFTLRLAKAMVQGANAPIQVSRAIRAFSERSGVDVVAVVRGGGSKSDLASFDHEYVARAIAACPVPVLTGIGHDNDRSIADEMAQLVCRTPTACAQALIDRVRAFQVRLAERSNAVAVSARRVLAAVGRGVDDRQARVRADAGRAVRRSGERLDGCANELATRSRRMLASSSRLLDRQSGELARRAPRALVHAVHRLELVGARVDAVDPRVALERGWSITVTDRGRLVRSVDDVQPGDALSTRLRDGHVASTVTAVDPQAGGERS